MVSPNLFGEVATVLTFACPCGAALRVSESDAGLPVCCPACSRDVTAPGEPLRPWNRNERGTLLDNPDPDALPVNDPENPLAFVGPGEMARERDRAVRAAEAAAWYETPNHREPKAQPHGLWWGLFLMAFSVVWGVGWICLVGPSKTIVYVTIALFVSGMSVCLRAAPVEPQKKR